MCLAQDNDVVHTPDRSDQPFDEAILPGRGRCDRLVPDADGAQSACHDGAVDPIAVSDHVTRSPVPRKGLGYLTCNPLRCRVGCDVHPNEISAIEPDDDETASKDTALPRSHLPHQPNPHSAVRANLRAPSPAVLSLAAFGRRPPAYVAPMSLAGIRNPQHHRKSVDL